MMNTLQWTFKALFLLALASGTASASTGEQVAIPSGQLLTLDVLVDDQTGVVEIGLTGPDTGWFSIGFGTTTSNGAYAIVVDATSGVFEQKLGSFTAGTTLPTSMLTILENSASAGTRAVRLE